MKILVVEDDASARGIFVELITDLGHEAATAVSIADAREKLVSFEPDVCITDLGLPDGDGLDVVRAARAGTKECSVLVLTGKGSVRSAIEAMKAGAHDFLLKPLKPALLISALSLLSERQQETKDSSVPLPSAESSDRLGADFVGRSPAMQEIFRLLARVARSNAPVMITGESGTGKEVAARTIHELSRRSARPFIALNCGAISPNLVESELFGHEKGSFTGAERQRAGAFEMAQGGTLFLDEVTEMSPEVQVKFLRVLETRSFRRVGGFQELDVDLRIIASSNRDLAAAVQKETFRSDLFYRLNVFPLCLPPLRERLEDVPALANHFLAQVEAREHEGFTSFEEGAFQVLASHHWPGNVRELRNAIHRAYVLSDPPSVSADAARAVLDGAAPVTPFAKPFSTAAAPAPAPPAEPARLPEAPAGRPRSQPTGNVNRDEWPVVPVRVGETLASVEQKLLRATLLAVNGNKQEAAEILGVSVKTVYNRLKDFELEP